MTFKEWTDGIGKFICNLEHWDQMILKSEKELTWHCIPEYETCPYQKIRSFNTKIDIIAIFASFGISLVVLPKVLDLIGKGIVLLVNRFVLYGTWTAPNPVIAQMWLQPAPAG